MVLTTPGIVIYLMFGAWFAITLAVLLGMDVLEHLGRAFGTGEGRCFGTSHSLGRKVFETKCMTTLTFCFCGTL